jgi:antimicrobial peptide system SdpB family protein
MLLKYVQNNFLFQSSPYSYKYQIPRAIIAIAQLINLTFTNPEYYFNNIKTKLVYQDLLPTLFTTKLGVILAIIILLWVISGYFSQISSILHAYVSYSFLYDSKIIEGGDQVALIITILLIPICLLDNKVNLWSSKTFNYKIPEFLNLISMSCFQVIKIQIAIVYLFAGVVKANVSEWIEGSAIYYWLNHTMGTTDYLLNIFSYLINSNTFSQILTWLTLILEFLLFGSIFMLQKQKNQLFYIAIFFHISIAVFFGLWAFSLIMISSLMFLFTPNFLKK